MQVSNPNNIKIYNLSAGKSLPEWISDRQKRKLQKNDPALRRRLELIQDFEMPTVSNCINVTKDAQYIFATGVYKPRVICYDVSQLSMKFERCMDAEVVKFKMLSDDYTKMVFLQNDRNIEFHVQHGRYYRTRIPKYGRDLTYLESTCDLYVVAAGPEIYRLNLEQGRFMSPLKSNASEIYCCDLNPEHHLFTCGTKEGHIECWDPRVRNRVGLLDCAVSSLVEDLDVEGVPGVTALKYRDGLHLAAGTSTGQILQYDIRSNKPFLVKDHNYGLPIKKIEYNVAQNLVLSLDSRILKIWDRETGKPFTSIEPGTELNDLATVPETGLLLMANEAPKMLSYYIPALGPAPKWCSFLDSLTEELEENDTPTVYDDYKFVTRTELEGLGLAHLVGTNLLRAYMHGYFMDIRLYHKAKSIAEPFAYEQYRKSKIREKIDEERTNRVKLQKLPKVNRALAEKLMEQQADTTAKKKAQKEAATLLGDDRFSKMFSDPSFQVDTESEAYRLLNPLVSKLDKDRRMREKKREILERQFDEVEDEVEGKPSSDEDSSDDEHTWTAEMKKKHREIQQEQRLKQRLEYDEEKSRAKFYELKAGDEVKQTLSKDERKRKHLVKKSLGDRLHDNEDSGVIQRSGSAMGNMEITFKQNQGGEKDSRRRQEMKAHREERKKIRRSAGQILKHRKVAPSFWRGPKR